MICSPKRSTSKAFSTWPAEFCLRCPSNTWLHPHLSRLHRKGTPRRPHAVFRGRFVGGLWIGRVLWRPPLLWVLAAAVFIAATIYFLNRRPLLARALSFGTCVLAGAFVLQVRSSSSMAVWLGGEQEVRVTAHVLEEGNLEEESQLSWRQRITVQTEQIASPDRTGNVRAGVRLNIYSKSNPRSDFGTAAEAAEHAPHKFAAEVPGARLFRYGERLRFTARLHPPRNYGNPGAFDYAGYLREQGIVGTASLKLANVEVLPGTGGNWLDRALARAHRSVLIQVHKLWEPQDAALIDALLIGEKTFIERPVRVDFQRSGTYHLLVVSGMSVAILAGFVLWALRRMGFGEYAASACSVLTIFAYAALTKQGAPSGARR